MIENTQRPFGVIFRQEVFLKFLKFKSQIFWLEYTLKQNPKSWGISQTFGTKSHKNYVHRLILVILASQKLNLLITLDSKLLEAF